MKAKTGHNLFTLAEEVAESIATAINREPVEYYTLGKHLPDKRHADFIQRRQPDVDHLEYLQRYALLDPGAALPMLRPLYRDDVWITDELRGVPGMYDQRKGACWTLSAPDGLDDDSINCVMNILDCALSGEYFRARAVVEGMLEKGNDSSLVFAERAQFWQAAEYFGFVSRLRMEATDGQLFCCTALDRELPQEELKAMSKEAFSHIRENVGLLRAALESRIGKAASARGASEHYRISMSAQDCEPFYEQDVGSLFHDLATLAEKQNIKGIRVNESTDELGSHELLIQPPKRNLGRVKQWLSRTVGLNHRFFASELSPG